MSGDDDNQDGASRASDIIKELAKEPVSDSKETEATEEEAEVEAETADTGDEENAAGTDEETADTEGDETDEGDEEDVKPKKKTRADRYRERIARQDQELAELRSRMPAGRPTQADLDRRVYEIVGAAPQENEFNGDYLAYDRALTIYELDKRQALREASKEASQSANEKAVLNRRRAEDHNDRVENFRVSVKDFDTIMEKGGQMKASPVVEDLILDSSKSAHLIYHLAKNPNELNTLNRMSEREAAREIGRIEAKLALPQPKTKSAAPKPIVTPKGASPGRTQEQRLDAYMKKVSAGERFR